MTPTAVVVTGWNGAGDVGRATREPTAEEVERLARSFLPDSDGVMPTVRLVEVAFALSSS